MSQESFCRGNIQKLYSTSFTVWMTSRVGIHVRRNVSRTEAARIANAEYRIEAVL